jgi:sugar lactone lactonase YvrE/nicotinamidase-related amidase
MRFLETHKTALVMLDLQNDVLAAGGAWSGSGAPEHAKAQNIIPNVASLADCCRSLDVPVIHVHFIVESGAPGLKQNAPIFRDVRASNALVRGSWGAAPVDGLEPKDGDYVVEKTRVSGFYDTKLDILLKGVGAETVIITGAWTNMSVEVTARYAADAGYNVIVARDGTSTINDEWQAAGLDYALKNIGETPTCKEIEASLRKGSGEAGSGLLAKSPRIYELVSGQLERLGTGFTFTEGPIWNHDGDYLLFSDMPGDVRRRWDATNGVQEVEKPSNKGNGMTYDADGNLIICEHATSQLIAISPAGERTVLASHFDGKELNSPNDVVVGNDGSIYFSDPPFGRVPVFGVPRDRELDFQGVYRIPAGGGDLVLELRDLETPNGLCFSPDGSRLYVNDSTKACIWVFDVQPDGSLANRQLFFEGIGAGDVEEGFPDGMKCDEQGNVYVSGPTGVWVISPEQELLGVIRVPEVVGNMGWGGSEWKDFFICATTSLYRIRMNVAGADASYVK